MIQKNQVVKKNGILARKLETLKIVSKTKSMKNSLGDVVREMR